MIQIIPAVDLIGGKCKRLKQGEFKEQTEYDWDPVELAKILEQKGFERLHLVDLEGAGANKLVHLDLLKQVTRSTGLRVDYGGGVRTLTDVQRILDGGAAYVTIGSIAVEKPEILRHWMHQYGDNRFILAADVRNNRVITHAWRKGTDVTLEQLVASFLGDGLTQVLCTDISRDGMLQGTNGAMYQKLKERFPDLQIIASGGVTSEQDILQLERSGVDAAVVGKALFEGYLNMDRLAAWNRQ